MERRSSNHRNSRSCHSNYNNNWNLVSLLLLYFHSQVNYHKENNHSSYNLGDDQINSLDLYYLPLLLYSPLPYILAMILQAFHSLEETLCNNIHIQLLLLLVRDHTAEMNLLYLIISFLFGFW